MPIPHLKLMPVSRQTGGSAAVCVAYAMGWGRYRGKANDVLAHGRAGPDLGDWSRVDLAEIRRDAKVARTVVIGLPFELPLAALIVLVTLYAEALRRRHGMAIAWAIHAPCQRGDQRNIHVHLVLSTRVVDDTGVSTRKCRELDVVKTGSTHVKAWRKIWEDLVNAALAAHGRNERLDMRSFSPRP